ncbi:hypothetical protein WB861_004644 [Vibrio parahaemolyticus]
MIKYRNRDLPERLRKARIRDYKAGKLGKKIWTFAFYPLLTVTMVIFAVQICMTVKYGFNSMHLYLAFFAFLVFLKLFSANTYIRKVKGLLARIKSAIQNKLLSFLPQNIELSIKKILKKYTKWKRYVAGFVISISMLTLLFDIINIVVIVSAHDKLWDILSLSPIYSISFFIYFLFFESLDFNLKIADIYIEANLTEDEKSFLYRNDNTIVKGNAQEEQTDIQVKNNDKTVLNASIKKNVEF